MTTIHRDASGFLIPHGAGARTDCLDCHGGYDGAVTLCPKHAAADEMLEALREARDLLDAICPNLATEASNPRISNTSSEYGAEAVERYRIIRAAIARAEGEG